MTSVSDTLRLDESYKLARKFIRDVIATELQSGVYRDYADALNELYRQLEADDHPAWVDGTFVPSPSGDREHPLYEMNHGEKLEQTDWLPARRAAALYDSGWTPVQFGGRVREATGKIRLITPEEKAHISDLADEYSASK